MKKINKREQFLLLLRANVIQFAAGIIGFLVILILTDSIDYFPLKFFLKSCGYGFYLYLATPFIIYWLAYASVDNLSKIRLSLTLSLMAVYSYILWDAYFFFKASIGIMLSEIHLY